MTQDETSCLPSLPVPIVVVPHVDVALRWADLVDGQPGMSDFRHGIRGVDPDHPSAPPAFVQLPLEYEAGHGWRVVPALAVDPDV